MAKRTNRVAWGVAGMRTPTTMGDWIGIILIVLGAVGALVWLLPWSSQAPLLVPPALYDQMTGHGASKKPFAGLMNFVPVLVGIAVVTVCAGLLLWWLSRPMVIETIPRQRRQ